MTMYALIENKPEGRYTASLIGLPAIKGQGASKNEALNQLQALLTAQLQETEIVPVNLDGETAENPWLQFSDRLHNNPLQQEVAESIAADRSQLDDCAEEL